MIGFRLLGLLGSRHRLDKVYAAYMAQRTENLPFHLAGAYAPVLEERTLRDLEVIGRVPPDLRGTYVRNGPNPKSGFSPSWFAGEGMLHAVRIEDGRAVWYR